MTIISYAQNFEDIMLWRALKDVEGGFYIDIGANDPVKDSVTKLFYENGWHGVNVEPLPSHCADLLEDRPRDVNLQCAVGSESGKLEIWESEVAGWSTLSINSVEQHVANGYKGSYRTVPIKTLSEICSENVLEEVHFLKIDVEGFEREVILGGDFSKYRPWVLVIEATRPNSTEEVYEDWEDIVFKADYLFGYKDGLNRFYIAKEHSELLSAFHHPPNVFDNFILYDQWILGLRQKEVESKAREAESKAREAESKAQEAESKAQEAESKAQDVQIALEAIYQSRSWRITKPLRFIGNCCDLVAWLTFSSGSRSRRVLSFVFRKLKVYISSRPRLKRVVLKIIKLLPFSLFSRLTNFDNPIEPYINEETVVNFSECDPRVHQIYHDLKVSVELDKQRRL